MAPDYSLYLVTDSSKAILGDRDLVDVVSKAIDGGVTIVQYRDKKSDTGELIRVATQLLGVTKLKGVPLIINDRVDVAIAVGADGVHLGQDDMDVKTAREILGPEKTIGVTACSVEEALRGVQKGANYLGIGTMFATPTKEDTKAIIGVSGTKEILTTLANHDAKALPTVAIGGINESNVQRVIFQSKTTSKGLDGVAVVSAIIASTEPQEAARKLRALLTEPAFSESKSTEGGLEGLLAKVPVIVKAVEEEGPLCHNMTNLVVQNFAANIALAVGASPIMANYGEEAIDLATLGGALLINMGSVTPDAIQNYVQAMQEYNLNDGPIVFDPVGAGGTKTRRDAVKAIVNGGYIDVIKGNEREIGVVLGEEGGHQKGVDSGPSSSTHREKAQSVRSLAEYQRNVVVMTGVVDYLSDGRRTVSVENGHPFLSAITGSGCVLGTVIAAYLAVASDKLLAALAAVLVFEIAAERAANRSDVKGPGTFVPALIDELYVLVKETGRGQTEWMKEAKVEKVDV